MLNLPFCFFFIKPLCLFAVPQGRAVHGEPPPQLFWKKGKKYPWVLSINANTSGFGKERCPGVTIQGNNSSSGSLPLWRTCNSYSCCLEKTRQQSKTNSIITILLFPFSNNLSIPNDALEIQELQYPITASSLNGKHSLNAGKAPKES